MKLLLKVTGQHAGAGGAGALVLTTKLSKLCWRGNSPALPTVSVRWLVFAGP